MDVQVVSLIVGIVGGSVAALGLVLAWYRRPDAGAKGDDGWSPPRALRRLAPTRGRLAVVLCATIGLLTVVGTVAALLSSSQPPQAAKTPPRLTEAQYRSELSQICAQADEDARRIVASKPTDTVLGVNVFVERSEVGSIKALNPPDSLNSSHAELIGVWERRIALLDSIYKDLNNPDAGDVEPDIVTIEALTQRIGELTTSLGVPECGL